MFDIKGRQVNFWTAYFEAEDRIRPRYLIGEVTAGVQPTTWVQGREPIRHRVACMGKILTNDFVSVDIVRDFIGKILVYRYRAHVTPEGFAAVMYQVKRDLYHAYPRAYHDASTYEGDLWP